MVRKRTKLEQRKHESNLRSYRCVPCYALRRCALEIRDNYPLDKNNKERKFYMGDLIISTSTPDEAPLIMPDIRKILSFGGLNLTKWKTEDQSLLKLIGSAQLVDPENCKLQQQRVLGIPWNPITDNNILDEKLFFKSFSPKIDQSLTSWFCSISILLVEKNT